MKIQEVKELLAGTPSEAQISLLRADNRAGVQKLLASYDKRLEKEKQERARLEKMMAYEKEYFSRGAQYIAGVDEAGRGPLYGPCVIAAVILPPDCYIAGLNDSKQLSAAKREQLYTEIREKALAISVNEVSVYNIDKLNIYQATLEGMGEVLENLKIRPQVALIDAMPVKLPEMTTRSLIHGDALSVSIAAASIIAKVTRDHILIELDKQHPEYGFAGHKGYGSQVHMQAIQKYGALPEHRRSYEPIKSMGLEPVAFAPNKVYQLK